MKSQQNRIELVTRPDNDQADTVGCCSLRVEHITLHEEKDGKEYVVEFDFLGKRTSFADLNITIWNLFPANGIVPEWINS